MKEAASGVLGRTTPGDVPTGSCPWRMTANAEPTEGRA